MQKIVCNLSSRKIEKLELWMKKILNKYRFLSSSPQKNGSLLSSIFWSVLVRFEWNSTFFFDPFIVAVALLWKSFVRNEGAMTTKMYFSIVMSLDSHNKQSALRITFQISISMKSRNDAQQKGNILRSFHDRCKNEFEHEFQLRLYEKLHSAPKTTQIRSKRESRKPLNTMARPCHR